MKLRILAATFAQLITTAAPATTSANSLVDFRTVLGGAPTAICSFDTNAANALFQERGPFSR